MGGLLADFVEARSAASIEFEKAITPIRIAVLTGVIPILNQVGPAVTSLAEPIVTITETVKLIPNGIEILGDLIKAALTLNQEAFNEAKAQLGLFGDIVDRAVRDILNKQDEINDNKDDFSKLIDTLLQLDPQAPVIPGGGAPPPGGIGGGPLG